MTDHLLGCACPDCALAAQQDDDRSPPPPPEDDPSHIMRAPPPSYSPGEIEDAMVTEGGTEASRAWAGQVVTYSTGTGAVGPGSPEYSSEYAGYTAMTPAMEQFAEMAFELWDEVIAIDLRELENANSADIVFNYSGNTSGSTYTSTEYALVSNRPRSDYRLTDADIWMADDWWTHDQDRDLTLGSYALLTYLHEIGHALGLTHPSDYDGTATFAEDAAFYQDTRQYTVMSYFDAEENGSGTDHTSSRGRSYGSTPLLNDILAIQGIYGADMTTRTGDTTYGFNSTAGRDVFDFTINRDPVIAIWDAGGTDRLDFSGFHTDQVINLNAGEFSSAGALTNNVAIAYGVTIEQAVGGSGDDEIFGNVVGNVLLGGDGADTIDGGRGNDIIHGGAGADRIIGGAGHDWVRYGDALSGVTVDLSSGTGTRGDAAGDQLSLIEHVSGTGFDDDLTGTAAANRIYGGNGDDTLTGLAGNDFLLGHNGNDRIFGGNGNDILRGGDGADILSGGGGVDWVQYNTAGRGVTLVIEQGGTGGQARGDRFYSIENVHGSRFGDSITGNYETNVIDGGGGDDWLAGGGGRDLVRGDDGDDRMFGGPERDTLEGGAGADRLDGGTGRDFASYARAPGGVTVNLLSGSGSEGWADGDTLVRIEMIEGSEFNDRLLDDDGDNLVRGGGGDDIFVVRPGNDVLVGEGGADRFIFSFGDDVDRINAFSLGLDVIDLRSTGLGYDDLEITSFQGGDTWVGYAPGDAIILTGISPGHVTEEQFMFA